MRKENQVKRRKIRMEEERSPMKKENDGGNEKNERMEG